MVQIDIPTPIALLILVVSVLVTTYLACFLMFSRIGVKPTSMWKLFAGSLGALFPAFAFAFGSKVTGIEVTIVDRIIAMLLMMGLWGTTAGIVISHFCVKSLPIEPPIDPRTFE